MPRVTCGECSHRTEVGTASDAWKCPCLALNDDCDCDTLNESPGTEEQPPEHNDQDEITRLETRLVELRGGVAPEGDVSA